MLVSLLHVLLNTTKIPSVVQNLLLIFSRMINLDPAASVDLLLKLIVEPESKINGLQVFLDKIAAYQTVLKGRLVRNSL